MIVCDNLKETFYNEDRPVTDPDELRGVVSSFIHALTDELGGVGENFHQYATGRVPQVFQGRVGVQEAQPSDGDRRWREGWPVQLSVDYDVS